MDNRSNLHPAGLHVRRSPWRSRGYHPHFEAPDVVQSITLRLCDSVPGALVAQWRTELGRGNPRLVQDLRARISRYEDAGYGCCHLGVPEVAELVENALLHFDAERYRMIEWCVMPNHVHALLETFEGHPMAQVVQSWKTFTANRANRIFGRRGAFWMPDYFDRFVRDGRHFDTVRRYIRANPVQAGLCASIGEWRWSSAWEERG